MANITTQTIRVDLNTGKVIPVAYTHQNDSARTFIFDMYNGGLPYTMTGNTVKFAYKSPIVNGQYTVIAGSSMASGTVSGNTVSVTLPAAYTAISGVGLLTMIITPTSGTIRPVNIKFIVQKSADGDDSIAGASDFPAALDEIAENWLDENISIQIDDTLSVSGKAADAKVTGDEINELDGKVDDLKSDINNILRDDVTVYTPDMSNTLTYYNTAGSTILRSNGEFTKSTGSTYSDNYAIAVSEGDVFYITSTGKGSGAYAFISDIHETYANVSARYGVNSAVTNEKVTIPSGITYLIVNNWNVGNGMVKKVASDHIVYESDLEPIVSEVAKLNKCCKCVYSTRTIEYSMMTECLDIYIPAKVGYINYIFGRTTNTAPASEGGGDVWRLVRVDAVDNSFARRFHITQLGETEMGIKINERDDFIGGTTHGDEVMDTNSLVFLLDGKAVDVTTLTTLTEFETLQVFLVSNMYDPADHTTLVGVHGRSWTFDANGLLLDQTVEFKADLTLTNSYLPMLCVLRGNDTASTLQVTDTYIDDGNFMPYDVSVGGFTTYPNQLKSDVRKMHLIGKTSGVEATVEILEEPTGLKSEGVFLYNGANTYNKIYCCICGYGGGTANLQTVSNGDKWHVKSKIYFDVGA